MKGTAFKTKVIDSEIVLDKDSSSDES